MRSFLYKIGVFVDKIIPFLLFILFFIILGEIFLHEFMVKYHTIVEAIDIFIIAVFVIDLGFKYERMRNIPRFLRASWIEILAIFPFFLVFRFFEGILELFVITESLPQAQKVVHVATGAEKEVALVIKESSRAERFARFLRPIARSIRFFKLGNPEVRARTGKDIKIIEKDVEKGAKIIEKDFVKGAKIVGKDVVKAEKGLVKEVRKVEEEVEKDVGYIPRHIKASLFYEKPWHGKTIITKRGKTKKKKR